MSQFKFTKEQLTYGIAAFTTFAAVALGLRSSYRWRSIIKFNEKKKALTIVITGSTKGLGKAMAAKFARYGDNVVISSRSEVNVKRAMEQLQTQTGSSSLIGYAADVSQFDQVEKLAEYANKRFGSIDVWINNAAQTQQIKSSLADTDPVVLSDIVNTNVLGTMNGCKAALQSMQKENTRGHIFNLAGAGTSGGPTPTYAAYGFSKAGMAQLMKTLSKEAKPHGIGVHTISPGMVITDLLMSTKKDPRTFRIFNILAENPDTVADWICPRVRYLALQTKDKPVNEGNTPTEQYLRYLTKPSAMWRFATSFTRKNRLIDEQTGEPVH